jgi:hypothetical protein
MKLRSVSLLASGIATLAMLSTANAAVYNKKTKLTFSQPVHVPGVTLPAGSYYFKLVDSQSSRNIVQVSNIRQDKVYATILAIPDYRANPSSHTIVTFGETGAGCASAVKVWYYPGDTLGNRFVYGKEEAAQMAKSCLQPVPYVPTPVATAAVTAPPVLKSDSTEPAVVALVQAPVKTETPQAQQVDYTPKEFAKADADDKAGIDGEVPTEAPANLPKSASNLPALAIMGTLLFGIGAFGRNLVGKRMGL